MEVLHIITKFTPDDAGAPLENISNLRKGGRRRLKTTKAPLDNKYGGFYAKLEPLASHIRNVCKRVYTPGTHITIDEAMCPFRGRSRHTTKLKNKPIKEGYKIWVLAEHGYVWSWLWHSLEEGMEGSRKPRHESIPEELCETQQMIMRLALQLDYTEYDYILYLDNLFTSVPLLEALKILPIGATGTTRKKFEGHSPRITQIEERQ
jgi:hypothetical protein